MRARKLVLIGVVAASCARGAALPVPHLAGPDAATFEPTAVGTSSSITVVVQNTGTAAITVTATVDAPFATGSDSTSIPARSDAEIIVRFVPDAYEAAAGTLTIAGADQSVTVALDGPIDDDGDDDGHAAIGAGGDDCDDTDDRVHPDAEEVCDGVDNDCDEIVDDDTVDLPAWYRDADNDTYGTDTDVVYACERPSGYTSRGGDCRDDNGAIHPGATESWYDGIDQDCDGHSDFDRDFDGYDTDAVSGGDDCDDTDADIHPGADEVWYDGVDQDCDGASDFDQDGDGFDSDAHGGDDCDDTAPDTWPGAKEHDDGVDEDCDGWIDEDFLVAGDVIISEILVDPDAIADADGQYIELYTTSKRDVPIAGFTLDIGAGASALPAISLTRHDVLVLCVNDDPDENGGIACDGLLAGTLAADDSAVLTGPIAVDTVDWTGWSLPVGAALELAGDQLTATDNDDESAWCTATDDLGSGDFGTPGVVDAPCA